MIRTVIAIVAIVGSTLAMNAGTGISDLPVGKKNFRLNNDIAQNSLKFISDAPMEKIHGTADELSGHFDLNPGDLEATTGNLVVNVKSMKTAISKRDEHMCSPTWLDAEKYSTISFKVENLSQVSVTKANGKTVITAKANGKFTCHGVTNPLVADISIIYLPESSETKKRASGDLAMITAKFLVALKDYKITGRGDIVGSKVGEEIQIEASLFANS
ncbi:MAG: YceI family protein [Ignavibacteria bacterium]|nr:YceI family protein [Ignavibacteria bacterium]